MEVDCKSCGHVALLDDSGLCVDCYDSKVNESSAEPKEAQMVRYRANRPARIAYQRKYYESHKPEAAAYNREYYQGHKPGITASRRNLRALKKH